MLKRRLILSMLMFLMVGALAGSQLGAGQTAAAPLQQSNLLSNSSLEDPYESGAATGWGRWHQESEDPGGCSGPYAFRPEWARESNGALVRDGFVSQHIGNQFDTWHAGIYQNVQVQPGTTYAFSFWALGRASNEQFPTPSDGAVNLGVRAGIDPNGSGLWSDGDVVWGGSASPHDGGNQANWQQVSVEATAAGDQITVFIAADLRGANNCRAHLDVWFDQAQLTAAGPPPTDTPPPQPTSPPQPTAPPAPAATNTPVPPTPTETAEVEPTDTPEPTATATDTPEPGASICVNAFADANANGQHDAEEGAMAGVSFTVAREGQIVGTGVSTGPQPICFEDLDPGPYQVAQSVPNTLQMTTGASADVTLSEEQTLEIKFGSRQRAAEEVSEVDVPGVDTTTPDPEGVPDVEDVEQVEEDSGSSLLAMSGLAALIVAVILMGGLLFYFLRRRA